MKWQEKTYSFPMPIRYLLGEPKGDGLVILLHGYQDNAQSMLKRLSWMEADLPFQWLALNAPFPVPVWNADGFKEAYSWYFRDTSRNLVFVTPSATAERVNLLLTDLGLRQKPKVFFGFSQGGYLAPYVAKGSEGVRGIIGLGCGFTSEGYGGLAPTKVFGLHGEKDERISLEQSRGEHAQLLQQGFSGSFQEIPELTHKVDPAIEPLIRQKIDLCFKEETP